VEFVSCHPSGARASELVPKFLKTCALLN